MEISHIFRASLLLAAFAIAGHAAEQGFIADPNQSCNRIEFFTLKPQEEGSFPVIFLLHGHQMEPSTGGRQFVDMNWLDYFVKEGIAAVAVSIPGFGNSDGKRDFSGPDSQKAVAAVIDHFSRLPFIDSRRMGLYGIAKGATLASMVPVYYPDLLLQILEAGWYDLTSCSPLMPDYLASIRQLMADETGGSEEALKERSAIFNTQSIQSRTLLLVGEFDDRRTLPSAIVLDEKLREEGKTCQLKVFPNELHILSSEKWNTIIPFLRQHFFDLYGIGISPVLVMPAIHVAKIYSGSPAEISGKLRVGDVILRISPNNDEEEIDLLRVPIPKFTSLVLGKKGTALRLHVQHFDQSYEDIVIERGL